MTALLRALRAARKEFSYAIYFADWDQRRDMFAAMTLFDVCDEPGAAEAYYLAQRLLKRLNEAAP